MAIKKHIRTVAVVLVCVAMAGCAVPYRMDRPYDPDITKGETLFDQIPNWDQEAQLNRQRGR